jgi:hypothetical protein
MTYGIGAGGMMGIAHEVTPNTYVAPTKFFPFESESLKYTQETIWRRPIRQSADVIGAVDGNVRTEGDISMEAFEDVVPYFLYCARVSIVKSAGPTDYTYTCTPTAVATPVRTMSITIVRNGIVFGYTGVVVSSFTFTVDNGLLKFNCTLIGSDETVQSLPVPTWSTTTPYGAGKYDIQIPTSTTVFDADGFEFQVDDNGEAQYRLKNTGRGAQFIAFGERSVTLSTERDFQTRTEYDAYKALTAQSITIVASKSATNRFTITMPVAIKDEFTVNLGGQGDLIRASMSYQAVIDAGGNSYTLVVATQESIT